MLYYLGFILALTGLCIQGSVSVNKFATNSVYSFVSENHGMFVQYVTVIVCMYTCICIIVILYIKTFAEHCDEKESIKMLLERHYDDICHAMRFNPDGIAQQLTCKGFIGLSSYSSHEETVESDKLAKEVKQFIIGHDSPKQMLQYLLQILDKEFPVGHITASLIRKVSIKFCVAFNVI